MSCLAISELPLPLREQLQRKLRVTRALAEHVPDRSACAVSDAPGDHRVSDRTRAAVDGGCSLSVIALK